MSKWFEAVCGKFGAGWVIIGCGAIIASLSSDSGNVLSVVQSIAGLIMVGAGAVIIAVDPLIKSNAAIASLSERIAALEMGSTKSEQQHK